MNQIEHSIFYKKKNNEMTQSPQLKCYNKKMNTNEEFYHKERERINEYVKQRYNNDLEFKEKRKEYAKVYYQRKKEERMKQNYENN